MQEHWIATRIECKCESGCEKCNWTRHRDVRIPLLPLIGQDPGNNDARFYDMLESIGCYDQTR